MAFDDSQSQSQDDEEQANQANQVAGNPNTQLSGGGGGFAGSGGAQPSSQSGGAGADQKPSSSGDWTNLNSYLTANADQSSQIGQGIASTVGNQAQQAQSDLASVQQGFQNQTPYSTLNSYSPSQIDSTLNASQYATPGSDTTNAENILNDNWGITPTVSDITQYAPASGQTGPSWNTAQNDYTTANQNLQDTQTESGRDVLLQNQYGQSGTQYTPGEQNFDQLLLEQNPGNQSQLNAVYNQYSPGVIAPAANSTQAQTEADSGYAGLSPDLYNAIQTADTYNTNEQNLATQDQTQANTDLTNQITGLGQNLSGEETAAQNNFNNNFKCRTRLRGDTSLLRKLSN
jgi:hypothetical protein